MSSSTCTKKGVSHSSSMRWNARLIGATRSMTRSGNAQSCAREVGEARVEARRADGGDEDGHPIGEIGARGRHGASTARAALQHGAEHRRRSRALRTCQSHAADVALHLARPGAW